MNKPNKCILGIESSCDDTCVAIVSEPNHILSNIVISQDQEHKPFSGVVPEIAARSHMQNLKNALTSALDESGKSLSDISAIAATTGPGLIGGVIVGAMFGRSIASVLGKPFISINHLEGHLLTIKLTHNINYPYLLLLASGGHCQFINAQGLGKYSILGQTIDDSVGESFDKVAKMLKLGFPGGPKIEQLAKSGDPLKFNLPKPLINSNDCNMSFSGLKTAVNLLIQKLDITDVNIINDVSASFQYTIASVLTSKMRYAIKLYEQYSNNKLVVVSGGVAANQYLINILKEEADKLGYSLISPPIKLCTDNAAMIAYAGLERLNESMIDRVFCPKARWSLEEL